MPAPSINDRTSDASYKEWFKFNLKIRDRFGTLLHEVDQFEDVGYNEGLNLYRLSCTKGALQTGFFDLAFFDNERIIDMSTVGLGNIVEIQGSKRQDTMKPLFYGFCREIEPSRLGGDSLRWRMSGFGSGVILREMLVNIEKKARLFDLSENGTVKNDDATRGNNLVLDLLTNPEYVVYGEQSLQELMGCTLEGIDIRANDTVPFLSAINGEAENVIRQISDTIGTVYGLNNANDFYWRYPTSKHSNINIKVLQKGEQYNSDDFAAHTAYVIGPYSAPISIREEDGYANVARSSALSNRQFSAGSATSEGFKALSFQALGQRFIPGSLGFSGLGFMLDKIGEPKSPQMQVNGAILTEVASPIGPSNTRVATFFIKIDDIPQDSPEPVEEINMKIINNNFNPDAPHWIALYLPRTLEWDENNAIRWYHNNDFTTSGQYSAVAVGATRDTSDPPWQIFPAGPTFAYATYQSLRHEVLAADPFAVDRYGPIMMDVPNDFIDDTFTMNKYLNTQLAIASVPQIRYSPLIVRIPNDMSFEENTQATFWDEKIGASKFVNRQVGIQQVRYDWDAFVTGRPGIKTCELTVLGYYDWLVESEPITICQNI